MLEFLKNRAELAVEYAETASPGVVRGGLDKQVELALLLLLVLNELNELIRDLCADEPAPLNFRLRLRFQQNPAGPANFIVVVVYHLELEFALVVHDQLVPALAVQLLGYELFLEAEHLEMD